MSEAVYEWALDGLNHVAKALAGTDEEKREYLKGASEVFSKIASETEDGMSTYAARLAEVCSSPTDRLLADPTPIISCAESLVNAAGAICLGPKM